MSNNLKENIIKEIQELYSDPNKTSIDSIEQVANNIMKQIDNKDIDQLITDTPPTTCNGKSTKLQSYHEFMAEVNHSVLMDKIYTQIDCFPNTSRAELADQLGIRISTICARVSELMKVGLIYVSGTTKDVETGRTVQTLSTAG